MPIVPPSRGHIKLLIKYTKTSKTLNFLICLLTMGSLQMVGKDLVTFSEGWWSELGMQIDTSFFLGLLSWCNIFPMPAIYYVKSRMASASIHGLQSIDSYQRKAYYHIHWSCLYTGRWSPAELFICCRNLCWWKPTWGLVLSKWYATRWHFCSQ